MNRPLSALSESLPARVWLITHAIEYQSGMCLSVPIGLAFHIASGGEFDGLVVFGVLLRMYAA